MKRIKKAKLAFFVGILFMGMFVFQSWMVFNERACSKKVYKQNLSRIIIDFKEKKFNTTRCSNALKNKKRPKFSFIKEPKPFDSFCRNKNCIQNKEIKWKMFTFVKSSAGNSYLRQIIRRTWASIHFIEDALFYSIFVVGESTDANMDFEHEKYGDILHVNVSESYGNLVYKSLASMQWASANLPGDCFYSVVDDDMLVHIGWVHEYVSEVRRNLNDKEWPGFPILCMYGHQSGGSPNRNKNNKYYSSFEEYSWPFWPDFCLGGMYTTDVDTVHKLFIASRTEKIVHLEDVWITGILRRKLGMPKEYLVPVQPPAAMHLQETVSKKQKPVSLMNVWRKLQPLLRNLDHCSCN